VNLSDIIPEGCVLLDLKSTQKEDVLREMLEALVVAGKFSHAESKKALKGLMDREELQSTGIGDGVAVPHWAFIPPFPLVCVFGRSAKGIDFNAIDGRPVDLLLMLISVNTEAFLYLGALKCISQIVRKDHRLQQLRKATDAQEIRALLREAEFA